MHTILTNKPHVAARILRAGGVVAFPTETVYGLGALAFDSRAAKNIFKAKGRPHDNPLIVHIASRDQVHEVASSVPAVAQRLMDAFWPGPLTVVLPRAAKVPTTVTAGLETVGIRLPAHPVARAFLRAVGAPVAAPSANRSGRPSPTSWEAVREDLNGRISAILKGNRARVGLESTVVDCTGRAPVVLRSGAVTLEQLREIAPKTRLANVRDVQRGRSPGVKHRHYAPRAVVLIGAPRSVRTASRSAWIGLGTPPTGIALGRSCRTIHAYAKELFHFFRACETAGIGTIYCQPVALRGIGVALMDRLQRAASGSAR